MPSILFDTLVILGLSLAWMCLMILCVNGLPRQLRRGEVPTAEPGTPEAFGLFWLDQYSWIGITVGVLGLGCLAYAFLVI